MAKIIGIIGSGTCSPELYALAREVGKRVAQKGGLLVCGGLGGIMEAASRGAYEAGGITVGILPGTTKSQGNPYLRVPIVTGLGHARNILVVQSSDVIIAISGGYGTLSEIGIALKVNKPVIGLRTWPDIKGVWYVTSIEEALELAFQ